MTFAVIGAVLGLIFGGPLGLLLGAVVGYISGVALTRSVIGGLRVAQTNLMDSTFSIMGALCKADNVVTRDEINAVERIFDMLRMDDQARADAKASFNRGKQPDFDLDDAVDRFRKITRGRGPLIQLFLQLQCMAVAADGRIDPAEHAMLVRIAQRLGLSEYDVQRLEALLRASTGAGGGQPGTPPGTNQLEDAYQALGLTPQASDAEVKRAYRKLISENHPDKLAARGLPDTMRAVAEERSREINKAYDLVKESRGMS